MIEACHNLSCLSHGTDPHYIWLHAQTHQAAKYFPKHAYRASNWYNTNTETHPWYGASQGTGDAAVKWMILSHSLITAYQSE